MRMVHGGALLSQKEMIKGLGAGQADFGAVSAVMVPEWPIANTLGSVFDIVDWGGIGEYGTGMINREMFRRVPRYRDEAMRENAKALFTYASDGYGIVLKSPITTLAGFKGKKIRTAGVFIPVIVQAFGGTPMTVGSGEVYIALQTGVLDGAVSTCDFLRSQKWYEPAKNLYLWTPPGGKVPTPAQGPNYTAMNLDSYKKLPDDLKKIVDEEADKIWRIGSERVSKLREEAEAEMVSKGVMVSRPSKEEYQKMVALVPPWDPWAVAQLNKLGENGEEIVKIFRQTIKDYVDGKLSW